MTYLSDPTSICFVPSPIAPSLPPVCIPRWCRSLSVSARGAMHRFIGCGGFFISLAYSEWSLANGRGKPHKPEHWPYSAYLPRILLGRLTGFRIEAAQSLLPGSCSPALVFEIPGLRSFFGGDHTKNRLKLPQNRQSGINFAFWGCELF